VMNRHAAPLRRPSGWQLIPARVGAAAMPAPATAPPQSARASSWRPAGPGSLPLGGAPRPSPVRPADTRCKPGRRLGARHGRAHVRAPTSAGSSHAKKSTLHDAIMSTLPEGFSLSQSSRWQSLAQVPDDDFELHLAEAQEREEEVATASVYRLATPKNRRRLPGWAWQVPLSCCAHGESKVLVALPARSVQVRGSGQTGMGSNGEVTSILSTAQHAQRREPMRKRVTACLSLHALPVPHRRPVRSRMSTTSSTTPSRPDGP
jgi:hypothetical protein